MNKTNRINRQKQIISELLIARNSGFIDRIEAVLEEKEIKIVYDPDAAMYKNEWSDLQMLNEPSQLNDLENLPTYKSLCITFSSNVLQKTVQKIADYVCNVYQCKHTIYKSRVDFFDFK